MLETQKLKDAFISAVEPIETQLCPFINLRELEEAIVLYYAGDLDYVAEEYFQRLYMDAKDLIPGKTLLSVLDSATLRRCLMEIPLEHRTVLNAYYGDAVAANVQMGKWCPPGMRLCEYQSYLLPNAINALAFVIHQMM